MIAERESAEIETRHKIQIMALFVMGVDIEFKPKKSSFWAYTNTPKWDWEKNEYRTKQIDLLS